MSQAQNTNTEYSDAQRDRQPDPLMTPPRRNDTDQAVMGSPNRQFSFASVHSLPSDGERGHEVSQVGQWSDSTTPLHESPRSAGSDRGQIQQQPLLSSAAVANTFDNFGSRHTNSFPTMRTNSTSSMGQDTAISQRDSLANADSHASMRVPQTMSMRYNTAVSQGDSMASGNGHRSMHALQTISTAYNNAISQGDSMTNGTSYTGMRAPQTPSMGYSTVILQQYSMANTNGNPGSTQQRRQPPIIHQRRRRGGRGGGGGGGERHEADTNGSNQPNGTHRGA